MEEAKYTKQIPKINKEKISKKVGEILKDLTKDEFTVMEAEEVIKALKEVIDFKKNMNLI